MKTFIKIHPSDSVAVALAPLPAGTALQVAGQTVTLLEDIPPYCCLVFVYDAIPYKPNRTMKNLCKTI